MTLFSEEIIQILKSGGIGVIPTDTLYGIVGRAELPKTVERIYRVRNRDKFKPSIILISSITDLEKFNVDLSLKLQKLISDKNFWPGKVSIIFDKERGFEHLTRGTKSLSFRFPDNEDLQNLIAKTGPLIAPSANTEGKPPARNIEEAKVYFGTFVDFYVDGGNIEGDPSTLIKFNNNEIVVLREGAVKLGK